MKRTLTTVLIVILAALGAFALWQYLGNRNTQRDLEGTATETRQTAGQEAPRNNQLSEILENPSAYYDQEVAVEGNMENVFETRVFKLSGQGDSELWVVAPNALTADQRSQADPVLPNKPNTRVNGTLRQVSIAMIRDEFGINISDEIEARLNGKPILVANRITFINDNIILDISQNRN